jgi:hypothetical protein
MGAITRGLANNITTAGRIAASGVNDATVSAITSLAIGATDNTYHLVSSQTASSSASISFTSGLDSTYDVYVFRFINIHPETDGKNFEVDFSTDGGSNYNLNKQTVFFQAYHDEADVGGNEDVAYNSSGDLQNTTGGANLTRFTGNDNDQSLEGEMFLFNPSDTTFVKHFKGRCMASANVNMHQGEFLAGYVNTTSAINAVKFSFNSGDIDSGTIKLYGVRDVSISGI